MDIPEAMPLDLDNLTPEQGAEYLRSLKVEGTDEELQQASREYWNHALALTLLGTYLVDFCGADIRRRIEIPELMGEDAHAHRVIDAYERMFAGKPELDILRALGYFDRPAEPEALKLVLPEMADRKYRAALKRLHDARLILTKDPTQPLDCHPLVREHFAADATREGHARLYEHYSKQAPYRPDTLGEMTPLLYAVYHGCQAGRHQEALEDIYYDRVLRGNEFYMTKKLGAFGTDLSLLANFFESPWTQPVTPLSPADQSWVISNAGSALRAVGRLADAVDSMRISAEYDVESEHWANAAVSYGNLTELHLALGNLSEVVAAARQAVDFADRSGSGFHRVIERAKLANALHQSGDLAEALRLFVEAERIEAEHHPEYPMLDSLAGYEYCDLLFGQEWMAEVTRRASETIRKGANHYSLLSIGLDHLSLGRAHPSGSAEATHHLDQAVDFLRRSGQLQYLPLALLARGTPHDLDEVFRIATRSGMRLHLADYHLASARLALTSGDRDRARAHLEKAEALIRETGYHRRDPDLAALRAML